MLCITMEVEPRITKQYKCNQSCSCKNYRGKGMESGKKCLRFGFQLTEDHMYVEKMWFWAYYSTSNKLLFVSRHIINIGHQKWL